MAHDVAEVVGDARVGAALGQGACHRSTPIISNVDADTTDQLSLRQRYR
jgi:hypothetical protein